MASGSVVARAKRYEIVGKPEAGTFGVEDTHSCPCYGRTGCSSCGGLGLLYGNASDPGWLLSWPIQIREVVEVAPTEPGRAEGPSAANANTRAARPGDLQLSAL